jgi:hypothetical protein
MWTRASCAFVQSQGTHNLAPASHRPARLLDLVSRRSPTPITDPTRLLLKKKLSHMLSNPVILMTTTQTKKIDHGHDVSVAHPLLSTKATYQAHFHARFNLKCPPNFSNPCLKHFICSPSAGPSCTLSRSASLQQPSSQQSSKVPGHPENIRNRSTPKYNAPQIPRSCRQSPRSTACTAQSLLLSPHAPNPNGRG